MAVTATRVIRMPGSAGREGLDHLPEPIQCYWRLSLSTAMWARWALRYRRRSRRRSFLRTGSRAVTLGGDADPEGPIPGRQTAHLGAGIVNRRGAVELKVAATEVPVPHLGEKDVLALGRWAENSFEAWCPNHSDGWSEAQLSRLMLASALQSRLNNTASASFAAFDRPRDASTITLRQLALLTRSHYGQAGQAFEIAVADACNASVESVVEPIQRALHAMGLVSPDPPRILLLGLEKVHPSNRDAFYRAVFETLPDELKLTTKSVGRPMSATAMLEQISRMNWRSLNEDAIGARPIDGTQAPRWQTSQMGRADAIVYTSDYMTLASLKIQQRDIDPLGWKHVPLWITVGGKRPIRPQQQAARCPTYIAALRPDSLALVAFRAALAVLDAVVARLGKIRPIAPGAAVPPPGTNTTNEMVYDSLVRTLVARADQPVEQILADLHESVHPGVREMIEPQFTLRATLAVVPILDNSAARAAWKLAGDQGRLATIADLFTSAA